jgi:hypothetical protein
MTARVFIHPAVRQRYSPGDITRSWTSRGYLLSNTKHGRVEVHPASEPRRSVVQSIFDFAARPQ